MAKKITPDTPVAPKDEVGDLNRAKKQFIATAINDKVHELDNEVSERNAYMDERDSILYDSDEIFEELDIKPGFDKTKYNFLPRAKEIHTFQVMGRGFNIITRYDKEDTSIFEDGTPEKKQAEMKNKSNEVKAANANSLLDGVLSDNGGKGVFLNKTAVASAYGVGIIKKYVDGKEVKLVSIESPQNFRAGWSSTNFRERDFDVITYQISVDSANRLYKDKLEKGQTFTNDEGTDFSKTLAKQTSRQMVSCVDWVGRHPDVNDGETFHALVVGDKLVGY